MRLLISSLFFLLAFPVMLLAQSPLDPGFQLLEQGNFAEATHFFAAALEQDPGNRTARICYGRAVGLNGQPGKALTIFTELQTEFPNSQEIQLNRAEAFMWDKKFAEAESLYDQLLIQDSLNFTAHLGAANARAGQKDYTAALPFIQGAHAIQPGNANALVSKKFILLGIAGQEKSQWNYSLAHEKLDEVETIFPGDKDARLLRTDLYLSEQKFRAAQLVYQELLDDGQEVVRAYGGLSYTSILLHKKKDALIFAGKALEAAGQTGADSLLQLHAGIQFVNALGVNRRFQEAFQYLDEMEGKMGEVIQIRLARARLQVWNNDLQEGEKVYEALLAEDSVSFEMLMGMFEAKRATQQLDAALYYLQQARGILPDQPDAFRLWQELLLADRPALELNGSLLKDSGGNIGQGLNAHFEVGRSGKFYPYVAGTRWQAYQEGLSNRAQQHSLVVGSRLQLNAKLKASVEGGTTIYQDAELNQKMALLGKMGVDFRMGKYHNVAVAFSRDLHNYTADLVRSGILRNNLALTYNFASPSGMGFYGQYLRTLQSDGNSRNLIFSSLYFQLLEAPQIKAGLNYSTFGFQREEAEKYFSPKSSSSAELFIQLVSDRSPGKKLFYEALFGVGVQKVSINDPQQSMRLQLAVGYRLAHNLDIQANYQSGNTVQSSISGYAFTQIGLQIRYQLPVPNANRATNTP